MWVTCIVPTVYVTLRSFWLFILDCFQGDKLGIKLTSSQYNRCCHTAEINFFYLITSLFYEFSAWVSNTFFSLDFMICWLVWHKALARMSSLYKCWQEWSRDVPDGMAHMQFALWPGRLMNPFGS